MEIRHKITGAVLYTAPKATTTKEAVEAAVKARANLAGAYLADANLARANLAGAYLADANLAGANLDGAYLAGANLAGANLDGAYLAGAYLADANLAHANLAHANLDGAYLADANLGALGKARISILPAGDLIAWKKCQRGIVVKLKIPADARRSNSTGRKCRAEFADVLEVLGGDAGISCHDGKTRYVTGERVTCDAWCEEWWNECAGGIHFFITREEAEAY